MHLGHGPGGLTDSLQFPFLYLILDLFPIANASTANDASAGLLRLSLLSLNIGTQLGDVLWLDLTVVSKKLTRYTKWIFSYTLLAHYNKIQ